MTFQNLDGSQYADFVWDLKKSYDFSKFAMLSSASGSSSHYTGWYRLYGSDDLDMLFDDDSIAFEYNAVDEEEPDEICRGQEVIFDKPVVGRYMAIRIHCFGKTHCIPELRPLRGIQKVGGVISAVYNEIAEEVRTVKERDPAAKSNLEVLLFYSGVHAILAYRVSHKLYLSRHYLPARTVSQLARFITGIEIHPGATIGKNFFIDHGSGVVIGETAEIGDDCTLYQGVTLGGTGKDLGKRHPTLGDHVMVGAGAKVLGPIKVGDHAKIAAGAVVLKEIPANSTAVGIPAKVVRRDGAAVEDLDQINIPDPIAKELAELREAIAVLKEKIK